MRWSWSGINSPEIPPKAANFDVNSRPPRNSSAPKRTRVGSRLSKDVIGKARISSGAGASAVRMFCAIAKVPAATASKTGIAKSVRRLTCRMDIESNLRSFPRKREPNFLPYDPI